jgi:hypothetical protein
VGDFTDASTEPVECPNCAYIFHIGRDKPLTSKITRDPVNISDFNAVKAAHPDNLDALSEAKKGLLRRTLTDEEKNALTKYQKAALNAFGKMVGVYVSTQQREMGGGQGSGT